MLLFADGFDHYRFAQTTTGTGITFLLNKWTSWFVYGGNNANPVPASRNVAPGLGRSSITDTLTGGAQLIGLRGITKNYNNPSNAGATMFKYLNVNCSTFYFGAALNYNPVSGNGSYTGDTIIALFLDLTTVQFDVRQTSLGTLYITQNGTEIGRATQSMQLGIWNYIEVSATLGTAGAVTVRVNGVVVINVTGVKNITSANSYVNGLTVGTGTVSTTNVGTGILSVDDLYFCDNTTSFNNNFLGDVRIRAVFPTMNGTLSGSFAPTAALWSANTAMPQFTVIEDSNGNAQYALTVSSDTKTGASAPAWATAQGSNTPDNHVTWECLGVMSLWNMVQENSPDSDSSYLYSNVLNDAVTFKFASVTGATVFAVGINIWARKDDAGFRSIRPITLSAGVTGITATDLALSTSSTYEIGYFPIDPSTSAPWSLTGLNAAEYGLKITV